MRLIDMICPHCGSALKVDADRQKAFCQYCGTELLIDDEVKRIRYENAEQTGYEFEKGRLRAQMEAGSYESPKRKSKLSSLGWVFLWIFMFPLPASILIYNKLNISKGMRILLIILLWAFFLIIGYTSYE